MTLKSSRFIPGYIAASVVGLVILFQILPRWWPSFDLFQRLEWMTYDWRVRQSMGFLQPVSTNLAAVFIDDDSEKLVNQGLGYTWPWPRQLYGRLVTELNQGGAAAIGFDILFQSVHPRRPETDVQYSSGRSVGSDEFFAFQLQQASNVVLAVFGETFGDAWRALMPADVFRTNTLAVGLATSEKDSDGVLRRVRPFLEDPEHGRIWHLGILMAAQALGLDLSKSDVLEDRIIFHGRGGVRREVPLDSSGMFYINWTMPWNDLRLTKERFEKAAGLLKASLSGADSGPDWAGKLVFVGSIGSGNNISDVGTTPLARETYLVSKYWNVANAFMMDRFIHLAPAWLEVALILLMGAFAFMVTLRLNAPWPSLLLLLTGAAYVGMALSLYVQHRFWIPVILPVLGGMILTHGGLVTYQVLFEQKEKRRVELVFSKVVSPDVVHELLAAEKLDLGGARKHITVSFTDVRGFTQMTDSNQEMAEAHVRDNALSGDAVEAFYDEQASMTLATVNDYLATIADQVKLHQGTLDKYIGDCVMAFWGAPIQNERHAVACVRAAIESHRAIHRLNQQRAAENQRREAENPERLKSGRPALPLLPILTLGTGINTGHAIVGLMGSEDHILNYTVFGRDVNLASRLESTSGRSRIIIGESTHRELVRLEPALAKSCIEQAPVMVKGIRTPVRSYEVPWRDATGTDTKPG